LKINASTTILVSR